MGTQHSGLTFFPNKHLIIGAGFCGLGVAAAFGRDGIPYDQVEADDGIGGNWKHGVYDSVRIISSRKTTEYKDWPMPSTWPDFPTAGQMLEYLTAYADHFGLHEHIELSRTVKLVEPYGLRENGLWRVDFEDGESRVYGGVVVANGHHWCRNMPAYPGEFDGEIIHSRDYRSAEQLVGRRVLVIGGGNSACDIAVQAARVAKSVSLSTRRGYWFMPKSLFGVPTTEYIKSWLPLPVQRAFLKWAVRRHVGHYGDYGLPEPDHRVFDRHPTINSEVLDEIRAGRIQPRKDVARFDGSTVRFKDASDDEFDLVVAATGYKHSFPFIAPGIVRWRGGMPDLVGGMFPRYHRNLYFFGTGQPRYGAGPVITVGAQTLAGVVRTQGRLRTPMGSLLSRLGQEAPTTWIRDPHKSIRQMKFARRILFPLLPMIESLIVGGIRAEGLPSGDEAEVDRRDSVIPTLSPAQVAAAKRASGPRA